MQLYRIPLHSHNLCCMSASTAGSVRHLWQRYRTGLQKDKIENTKNIKTDYSEIVVGAANAWGLPVKYRCESCRQIIKRCFNRTFPITITHTCILAIIVMFR